MANKNKKNIILGAGCLVIAAAIAVICIFGGKEADKICGDESPVGFFEKDDMPKFTLGEEHAYTASADSIFLTPKEVKNISEKEMEFCTLYAEEMNKSIQDEDMKWKPEEMVERYDFRYANAYAYYYGLKSYAGLSRNVKMPYIFDGGINCFVPKTQIYIHETNDTNDFRPVIDLKKEVKSLDYFAIYASSAYGTLEIDFTFSLYKKVDKAYEAYHFTFPATVQHVETKPIFYGGYFEDFGIDKSLLNGSSMIGVSYKIKNWSYDGNEEGSSPFIKLYELMLPESQW